MSCNKITHRFVFKLSLKFQKETISMLTLRKYYQRILNTNMNMYMSCFSHVNSISVGHFIQNLTKKKAFQKFSFPKRHCNKPFRY